MSNEMKQTAREAIDSWAASKHAHLTLETYQAEITQWSRLTGIDRVSSVLEIGCGSGLFLLSCLALGFAQRAVGIDPAYPTHRMVPMLSRSQPLGRLPPEQVLTSR